MVFPATARLPLHEWFHPGRFHNSSLFGYGMAVLLTGIALIVRLWLEPVLGDRIPFASFFAGVALTAWFGGFGACLLAVGLGALACRYFVLEPAYSFAITSPFQLLGLVTFIVTGLVIAGFSGGMRSAYRAMHAARLEAERRVREAEQMGQTLRTLLANVPEGITMAGGPPQFPIIAQSKFAEDVMGPAAQDVLGVSAGEHIFRSGIFRPDGVSVPKKEEVPLYRATRFGHVIRNEPWVLLRSDGSPVHVLVNTVPIRDAAGTIVGGIGCWRDVTEQRQLLHALQQSQERYRATFEQAAVGMAHVSLDGRWLQVNDQLCRMTGYSRDDLLSHTFRDITHPDDSQIDDRYLQDLLAGERLSYAIEKRYLRPDGGIVWVSLSAALIIEAGEPQYIVSVIEDISQRKEAEQEVQRLNAGLEQRVAERTAELTAANRELEAFSYTVSHDLRAPMRAIDGFSRIVIEDFAAALPAEARDYLNRIRASARNMAELVDDLLELSRLGRSPLAARPLDLREIAMKCAAELQRAYPQRSVELQADRLPVCSGDPVLLRQLLLNLLSNAFKFTRHCKNARIEIGSYSGEDGPVFYVRDNGAGFDMRYVDKIFGVFERLHSAEEYEGTGVGLAIVKRVVERHGGQVWAESRLGEGTTFYFTLRC